MQRSPPKAAATPPCLCERGATVFLDPKKEADPIKVFTVQDGILICEGTPFGYLITEKEHENYILKVQWRWGKKVQGKGRNSGVFVHVVGPNKIWPKSVEAQLMADHAGDFWLVDNFELKIDAKRQDPKIARHYYRMKDQVEKAIGEWNQYEITCKGDAIRLVINGQLVNEGTEAELAKDRILLQSGGCRDSLQRCGAQASTPVERAALNQPHASGVKLGLFYLHQGDDLPCLYDVVPIRAKVALS